MLKGAKFTEEHKRKLSIARRKRVTTDETRAKMSATHKSIKNNTGRFKSGMTTWNKGVKQWENTPHPMLGKTHTEEVKKRLSYTSTINNPRYWLGKTTPEHTKLRNREYGKSRDRAHYRKMGAISIATQNLKKGPNAIESAVYEELRRRNLLFEPEKIMGERFVVDVYIPSLNLVIECDGTYWHSLPDNIKRDKIKDEYLQARGYGLLRLKEADIENGTFIAQLEGVI